MVVETDASDDIAAPAGRSRVRRAAGWLVDAVLPPQCLACDTPVAAAGGLCASCWAGLRLIERPVCERLGIPLPFGAVGVSAAAMADPPPFDRCRAVALFGDVSRRLVHKLKYGDQMELARWMGGWMARAASDVTGQADMAVPVPLHRWRLWRRRYNQAALLAEAVATRCGLPVELDVLRRVRSTRQQVGLSATERKRNLAGAFAVTRKGKETIRGKRVLLVDDVLTTGTTIETATRTLLRAGAGAVDVAVFAEVVRGGETPDITGM